MNRNCLGWHHDSNSGTFIGFSHTTKYRSDPGTGPEDELETFARVRTIALTNRNIAGTVSGMTTSKGVIPAVLIAFATTPQT